MSKKQTAQNHAAKRNARAKSKRESIARANASPSAQRKKVTQRLMERLGGNLDFDNVLNNAVKDIKKNKTDDGLKFNNSTDMINGLKKAVGEVFKLYSYITLAVAMIDKGVINHFISMDLDGVTRKLMNFDSRIGTLMYMDTIPEDEREQGALEVECLDIGTSLTDISDNLYNEITRLEPHSLAIEEMIATLAVEVEGGDDNVKRMNVLQAVAYKYMAELKLADDAKASSPKVDEPAEAVTE